MLAESLPSYHIKYTKKGSWLKWKLLLDMFSILKAVRNEHKLLKTLAEKYQLSGVISDNRFGMYHKDIPSVYITHQLQVFSGITTFITTYIHAKFINKYSECWVPDIALLNSLSGRLAEGKQPKIPVKYLGVLSRFKKAKKSMVNTVLILLSGPEPQRTIFEQRLLTEFENYSEKVLFIRGMLRPTAIHTNNPNIQLVNFLSGKALQDAINSSEKVVCRSGYSTIMDLAVLGKKCFFVPTPGQGEQEYLAKYLQKQHIAPYCKQTDFKTSHLDAVDAYKGFGAYASTKIDSERMQVFDV